MKHPAYNPSEPRFFRLEPGEEVLLSGGFELRSATKGALQKGDRVRFIRYAIDGTPIVADSMGREWAVPWHSIDGGA